MGSSAFESASESSPAQSNISTRLDRSEQTAQGGEQSPPQGFSPSAPEGVIPHAPSEAGEAKELPILAERVCFDIIARTQRGHELRVWTGSDRVYWKDCEGRDGYMPAMLFRLAAYTLADYCEDKAGAGGDEGDNFYNMVHDSLRTPVTLAMAHPYWATPDHEANDLRFGFASIATNVAIDKQPDGLRRDPPNAGKAPEGFDPYDGGCAADVPGPTPCSGDKRFNPAVKQLPADEAAQIVAEALGRDAKEPGTLRLARALADATDVTTDMNGHINVKRKGVQIATMYFGEVFKTTLDEANNHAAAIVEAETRKAARTAAQGGGK